MKNGFLSLAVMLLLFGCGPVHKGVRGEGGLMGVDGRGGLMGGEVSKEDADVDDADRTVTLDNDEEVLGFELKNKDFDIPVVLNKEVLSWIRYFTGRGRYYYSIYMERKGQMIPIIVPKLREAGMPEDLLYLAMIESGFSPNAKSHARAVGTWQFMKATGRLYDLEASWWRDERRDPMKSTDAAIRYLKRLHDEFGSWELAASAYNSGEGRIRKAIRRLNTRDFWTIARDRRALRRETRDYVPKMMAAAIIGKNPDQFGFNGPELDPFWMDAETVVLPRPEQLRNIARVADVDVDLLRDLNPELLRCCTPPVKSYELRLPKGEAVARVRTAVESGELGTFEGFQYYKFRRGDTLSKVAKRFGVPHEAILSLNDIRNPRAIRNGLEIALPGPGFSKRGTSSMPRVAPVERSQPSSDSFRGPSSDAPQRRASKGQFYYVVKKGDTLYDISRRYSVTVAEIRDWNAMPKRNSLRPGKKLKLFVSNDQPET